MNTLWSRASLSFEGCPVAAHVYGCVAIAPPITPTSSISSMEAASSPRIISSPTSGTPSPSSTITTNNSAFGLIECVSGCSPLKDLKSQR
jgi:hypothetical protein